MLFLRPRILDCTRTLQAAPRADRTRSGRRCPRPSRILLREEEALNCIIVNIPLNSSQRLFLREKLYNYI